MRLKAASKVMPTRPGFDLISVRKETKERLARLKAEGSFDEALRTLMDAAASPAPAPLERPRLPSEQLALARLARRRWGIWIERGIIEEIGPRMLVYRTGRRERGRLDAREG